MNSNILCTECGLSIACGTISVKRLRKIFCGPCWIHRCDLKFRKKLSDIVKPDRNPSKHKNLLENLEEVIVEFDGTTSSFALLNLIKNAKLSSAQVSQDEKKPSFICPFNFTILYIRGVEEGLVKKRKLEELERWLEETEEKFSLRFSLLLSSIELGILCLGRNDLHHHYQDGGKPNIYRSSPHLHGSGAEAEAIEETFPFDPKLTDFLAKLTGSIKSKTSRDDFLLKLKYNLVLGIGKDRGVKRVVVGEDQTSLAVKMLSFMALGRGAQLADQMALVTQVEKLEILRPLMDLSADDLQQYLGSLEAVPGPSIDKKEKIETIQKQCEELIGDLITRGYPSTASTLTRMGGKLVENLESGEREENSITPKPSCVFCKSALDIDSEGILALCYGCNKIKIEMDGTEFVNLLTGLSPIHNY